MQGFTCIIDKKTTQMPLDQINSIPVNKALQTIIAAKKTLKSRAEERQGNNACFKHGKKKDIICLTDMISVCSDCVLFGIHADHKYIRLADFLA